MECTTNYYTTNKIENLWICCKMYRRSKIRLLLSFCSLLFLSGWLIIFQSLIFIFRFSGSLIQLLHIKDTYQMTSLFNFSLPLRTDPVDWESKTVSVSCYIGIFWVYYEYMYFVSQSYYVIILYKVPNNSLKYLNIPEVK